MMKGIKAGKTAMGGKAVKPIKLGQGEKGPIRNR